MFRSYQVVKLSEKFIILWKEMTVKRYESCSFMLCCFYFWKCIFVYEQSLCVFYIWDAKQWSFVLDLVSDMKFVFYSWVLLLRSGFSRIQLDERKFWVMLWVIISISGEFLGNICGDTEWEFIGSKLCFIAMLKNFWNFLVTQKINHAFGLTTLEIS